MRKAFRSCCLKKVGQPSNEGGHSANEGGTADLKFVPATCVAGIFYVEEEI